MKYQPPLGSEDPNASFVDGNDALGILGSIIPAKAIEHPQRELIDLIENGGGLLLDEDDLTQVRQAVTRIHRITSTQTIYVPAEYPTVQAALEYISTKVIPYDVDVVIELQAGDHIVNIATGTILLNQPFGHKITIRGQPLNGAFPSFSEVDNANHVTVEGFLRTRFPTRIVVQGNVNGMFMQGGQIKGIENICFIGDNTNEQHGLLCGQWINDYGWGNGLLKNLWFHRLGEDGMRLNYNSSFVAQRIGATHCGNMGFRTANVSCLTVLDRIVSAYNGNIGVQIIDQSMMEIISGEADLRRNAVYGLSAHGNSNVQLGGAQAVRVQNNGSAGMVSEGRSYIKGPQSFTGGSNGTDIFANAGGYIDLLAAAVSGATLSPAANTLGNAQSFIRTA